MVLPPQLYCQGPHQPPCTLNAGKKAFIAGVADDQASVSRSLHHAVLGSPHHRLTRNPATTSCCRVSAGPSPRPWQRLEQKSPWVSGWVQQLVCAAAAARWGRSLSSCRHSPSQLVRQLLSCRRAAAARLVQRAAAVTRSSSSSGPVPCPTAAHRCPAAER
jgi:hypothetical protein